MKNILIILGLTIGGFVGYKTAYAVSLKNFKVSEFRGEHIFLSTKLLKKLDKFREQLGERIIVSPAKGSMFLNNERENNSQHFLGKAIDIMLPDTTDWERAYTIAKNVGFTGIGFYPHWKPYKGFHVDVRESDGHISTWSGINPDGKGQRYVGLWEGLSYVSKDR